MNHRKYLNEMKYFFFTCKQRKHVGDYSKLIFWQMIDYSLLGLQSTYTSENKHNTEKSPVNRRYFFIHPWNFPSSRILVFAGYYTVVKVDR